MRPALSAISGAWEHATHCARGSRRVASFRCPERRELSSVMDAVQQQAWCRQWLSVAYRQRIRGRWDCKWPVMLSDLALLVVGGRREGVFGGRKRVYTMHTVPNWVDWSVSPTSGTAVPSAGPAGLTAVLSSSAGCTVCKPGIKLLHVRRVRVLEVRVKELHVLRSASSGAAVVSAATRLARTRPARVQAAGGSRAAGGRGSGRGRRR